MSNPPIFSMQSIIAGNELTNERNGKSASGVLNAQVCVEDGVERGDSSMATSTEGKTSPKTNFSNSDDSVVEASGLTGFLVDPAYGSSSEDDSPDDNQPLTEDIAQAMTPGSSTSPIDQVGQGGKNRLASGDDFPEQRLTQENVLTTSDVQTPVSVPADRDYDVDMEDIVAGVLKDEISTSQHDNNDVQNVEDTSCNGSSPKRNSPERVDRTDYARNSGESQSDDEERVSLEGNDDKNNDSDQAENWFSRFRDKPPAPGFKKRLFNDYGITVKKDENGSFKSQGLWLRVTLMMKIIVPLMISNFLKQHQDNANN